MKLKQFKEIVSFLAHPASDLSVPSGTVVAVTNYTEKIDAGNNFDPTTGEFTAPSGGIYQFHFRATWFPPSALDEKVFILRFNVNGSLKEKMNYISSLKSGWATSDTFSPMAELNAGDKVSFSVFHYASVSVELEGGSSSTTARFSGFKIK